MFNLTFVSMANVFNENSSSITCVDLCPALAKSTIKASMTILGIVLAPSGLPGKVLGGVAGYVVASKLVDKMPK